MSDLTYIGGDPRAPYPCHCCGTTFACRGNEPYCDWCSAPVCDWCADVLILAALDEDLDEDGGWLPGDQEEGDDGAP